VTETYRVLLTWHAENDLAGIYDYIAADSPANAAACVLEIEQKVSDHRAPHFAAIGPAHVQKYASPSRLPQPAAPCDLLGHTP